MGVLQSINARSKETQALVLSPTRELAVQSRNVMMAFGDYMNVSAHACIGGKSLGEDIRALQAGCMVISGTPGRVHDMINRRHLNTKKLKMLVIDEADEMLSKGFKEHPCVVLHQSALSRRTTSESSVTLSSPSVNQSGREV